VADIERYRVHDYKLGDLTVPESTSSKFENGNVSSLLTCRFPRRWSAGQTFSSIPVRR
jgi:hypothetical protein